MKGLISMYYNEKRKAITAKYVKTHLDDIKIRVPKGQREKLKSIASEMGMSMNQMFIKAVEEYIEKNYKPEAESETDWQIGIYRKCDKKAKTVYWEKIKKKIKSWF
mgnify:CR=1 FL=1